MASIPNFTTPQEEKQAKMAMRAAIRRASPLRRRARRTSDESGNVPQHEDTRVKPRVEQSIPALSHASLPAVSTGFRYDVRLLEGVSKVSELRVRLKVLSERSEAMWGIKEMKAALTVAGARLDPTWNADELRMNTKAMANAVQARWAEEAELEALKARAEGIRYAAKEKFRSRGAMVRSSTDGETPRLDYLSDSSEEDVAVPSFRATFRARGATNPSPREYETNLPMYGTKVQAEQELFDNFRKVLVPPLAEGTFWAHLIEQCIPKGRYCPT